jgi:hypothetical protein
MLWRGIVSRPLRLLKFAQEVSIGVLLLGTITILLVAMPLGATVAFFRSGVELAISACKRAWGVHGAFHVIFVMR